MSAIIEGMPDDSAPVRTELLTTRLAGAAVNRARLTRIDLAPGQATGRHRHPCDVVGYVIAGVIRFQLEGRDDVLLKAGAAFHEPRDTHVAHFDNASDTQPAAFLACYLLEPGVDHVIEMTPAD